MDSFFNSKCRKYIKMFKKMFPILYRTFSKADPWEQSKVSVWQLHEYGGTDLLQLDKARVPIIDTPSKVLIKVKATSLNPIDLLMIGGYGRTLFQIQRGNKLEFPLVLGRDFAGTIIDKGHGVGDKFHRGTDVYGFIPIHKPGAFAEVIVAETQHILPKPRHLSFLESAALVYTSITAWSALFIFGNMLFKQRDGLRVLILGASGGVGTHAVQILKSQNSVVFGTCSSGAVDLVYSLGADCVFNYNDPEFEKNVELEGRYHIILDCAKVGYQNIPKTWKYDNYITLNSPLLHNTDNYGLMGGLVQSLSALLEANRSCWRDESRVTWGFFVPSSNGFEFIHDLVLQDKLKPVIHKTFEFNKLPDAFKTMTEGHLRGKIVLDIGNTK